MLRKEAGEGQNFDYEKLRAFLHAQGKAAYDEKVRSATFFCVPCRPTVIPTRTYSTGGLGAYEPMSWVARTAVKSGAECNHMHVTVTA